MTATPSRKIAAEAVAEVARMIDQVHEDWYDRFIEEILRARKIVVHGVGVKG